MPLRLLIGGALCTVALSACSGALGVHPGDAVVSPDRGAPAFTVVVLAADDLVAIDATVLVDGSEASLVDGAPLISWQGAPVELDVSAPGFEPWRFLVEQYPDNGTVEFRLEPVVLSGVVTTNDGRPLPGVSVALGDVQDQTDNEGRYALDRAVAGTIELERPAWEPASFTWDGAIAEYDVSMDPLVIHAIRASPEDVLDADRWETILSLTDVTGING
ncbi:MAG TPA: carboxypeptidase-like regulatory domain-containing protein, partial [Acidimicrobiia bacterium]|nr:carboxypeptidase-like regulatory domain-containing protein [Acidimicrobiia bacterium]